MAKNQNRGKGSKLKTPRDKIRALVTGLSLFYDRANNTYAEIRSTEGRMVLSDIASSEFRDWFFDEFDNRFKEFLGDVQLNHAKKHASSQAKKRGRKINPDLRFNYVDNKNYIDLNRADGKSLCISSNNWSLENNSHTLFRRDNNLLPIKDPTRGGNPRNIFKYINVNGPQQEMLLMACLCCIPLSNIQRPIINLEGPPGSGKSTTAKIIKQIFDPCEVEVTTLTNSIDNMILSMIHDATPLIDNISGISQTVSDTFCKAVTGDGYKKRRHYTDDEMYNKAYRRPLIITSLSSSTRKPDFLSRCCTIRLKAIPKSKMIPSTKIASNLEKDMKDIRGGCLDVIVSAKRLYSQMEMEIKELPRLAEFALIGAGIAEVLGYGKKNFMKAVFEMQDSMYARNGYASDTLVKYIQEFIEDGNELKGTPTDVMGSLRKAYPEFEYTPQMFGKKLNDGVDTLKLLGIDCTFKNSSSGSRDIFIRKRLTADGNA